MKNYLKLSYIIIVLLFICWELNAQMALPTFQGFEKPHEVYESGSQTFSYTGAQQTLTVPSGVSTITIRAWGAQGGQGWLNGVVHTGTPGLGGYATGDLAVTPGQTINVYVGGQGGSNPNLSPGGYNGGGYSDADGDDSGGGGGGASDVRINGTSLSDRVLVAGGGGGAGAYFSRAGGGSGGGLIGGNGLGDGDSATGATQSTGFSIGNGGYSITSMTTWVGSAGGGGGGYYGGNVAGSGDNCVTGGGGGSSYIGGVSSSSTTSGQRSGNGQIIINW